MVINNAICLFDEPKRVNEVFNIDQIIAPLSKVRHTLHNDENVLYDNDNVLHFCQ